MHDLGFLLAQKREDLVDILAAPRTEAEMIQPDSTNRCASYSGLQRPTPTAVRPPT